LQRGAANDCEIIASNRSVTANSGRFINTSAKQYAEASGRLFEDNSNAGKIRTIVAQQCYPCTNNLAFFAARQKDSRCLQTLFLVPALSGCAARCPGPLRRRFHPLGSNHG
jgi:hypothetical protein